MCKLVSGLSTKMCKLFLGRVIVSTAVLGLTVAHGQTNVYHPFPDSSAMWREDKQGYQQIPLYMQHWNGQSSLGSDTMINTLTYKKILGTYNFSSNQVPDTFYQDKYLGAIRQNISQRKIFIVPVGGNTEILLYDFNLSVGNPIPTTYNDYKVASNNVYLSDSILIGNNYRKRFWVGDTSSNVSLIEGIGSSFGLMYPYPLTTNQYVLGRQLICFIQNGQTLYPDSTYNCTPATGINEIIYKLSLNIFPNPFSTQTTLQTDNFLHNATLTVDNCFGQTVLQIKNISGQTVTLFRDNLPSSLYFVRLTEENKTIATDKLVITDK